MYLVVLCLGAFSSQLLLSSFLHQDGLYVQQYTHPHYYYLYYDLLQVQLYQWTLDLGQDPVRMIMGTLMSVHPIIMRGQRGYAGSQNSKVGFIAFAISLSFSLIIA